MASKVHLPGRQKHILKPFENNGLYFCPGRRKTGLGTNDHLFAVIESYLKVPSEVSAKNGLRA